MKTMHLFAGIGGGLLADLILGHEPIIAVEWDAYACQVLRERAEEGWFPELSVWEGDVRLFDPSEYAGKVDCIHAGFPCQDISVAGKQAGVGEETRSGLYREVLRIAGVVRPRYLFLENVSAIVSNGLDTVISDITALGYDSEWLCLRASDCGANHHRDRWWLLANSRHAGVCERGQSVNAVEDVRHRGGICCDGLSGGCGEEGEVLAYPNSFQRGASGMDENAKANWWNNFGGCCEMVSNASSNGLERQRQIPIGVGKKLNHFSDVGWWEVEPGLGRVANGVPNRVGQLKGLGNAQVPLQAAVAWKLLGGE